MINNLAENAVSFCNFAKNTKIPGGHIGVVGLALNDHQNVCSFNSTLKVTSHGPK